MCEPLILSIGGKGPSECGTISPESANPFKAAKTFDPLVGPLRPISRTASLTPRSTARRAARTPVRYAAGRFPAPPFQPSFASSRDDADALTISPRMSASDTCTMTYLLVSRTTPLAFPDLTSHGDAHSP